MTELLTFPAVAAGPAFVGGGRYRIREQLGRGRASSVHAAYDERLRRPVAVRFFDDDVAVGTLAASAQAWTPGMSRVLDVDSDGRCGYLVRELVTGMSLQQLTAHVERRPTTIAAVGQGVAATLASLHRNGFAHGAVHAGNIFVRDFTPWQDWNVDDQHVTVVTDCGLGGRPAARCDPRDDIRDLGAALLGVLTGQTVLGPRTTRTALDRLRRGNVRARRAWATTVTAMTDIDPAGRPNAVEAIAALAALARHH